MKQLKKDIYEVTLEAVGNPDYDYNDYRSDMSHANSVKARCSSIKECQDKVQEFIDLHELGGGNWSGGEVFKNKEFIGYISYNCRFWDKNNDNFRKYHLNLLEKHNCK